MAAAGALLRDTLVGRVDQEIRFCRTQDGATLAYATHGQGPPLVRAATWLTHVEYDWRSPVWRHWLEGLGQRHMVIRYDERGCGLSDGELGELSLDQWVGDLESVVDAAGVERFALLGVSGGGFASVAYAVRHPERVSHLVLYGASARGRRRRGDPDAVERGNLVRQIIRLAWDDQPPSSGRCSPPCSCRTVRRSSSSGSTSCNGLRPAARSPPRCDGRARSWT
jgi:pimeloyl-ACP methyl ester carboxylesterase